MSASENVFGMAASLFSKNIHKIKLIFIMDGSDEKNLSEQFADGWKKFRQICDSDEPATSTVIQNSINDCQRIFVRCTEMVNQLCLFNKNEIISEVSTTNLKFLLLPVFLGELSLRNTTTERKLAVSNAQVYVNDFLKRCFEYQLTTKEHVTNKKEKRVQEREEKIQIYKQTKEIYAKIDAIDKRLKENPESVDEEIMRGYYLDWLQVWVNKSVENMNLIKSELEILEHMKNMKLGTVKPPLPQPERKPMKPILITREMIKKQVFGAGYRSLPTMSEEEYFQKELAEGKIIQEYSKNHISEQQRESSDEDGDDEEKLKQKREWDDWKDTHRRGDGNKERHG